MIPSFYPVRERIEREAQDLATEGLTPEEMELACGITIGPPPIPKGTVDPTTGLLIKTSAELLATAKAVRYADNPYFSYPTMLAAELNDSSKSPFTASGGALWNSSNKPAIAVIGGGMSGLMTAWQLSKLGATVNVFEASAAPNGDTTSPQGAGRICPMNITAGDPNTRGEFGAMRFPDTSYMFWHYMSLMVSSATTYKAFPNPGKVPTLLSGESLISPFWKRGGLEIYSGSDSGFNLKSISDRHMNAFLGVIDEYFPYWTLQEVSQRMVNGLASIDPITQGYVNDFWQHMSKRFYNKSYRDFLKDYLFTDDEINIIGYLGVGTGGFKALFDTCVLDVMRLFVWSYDTEYSVPDLYKLPYGIKNKLIASQRVNGGGISYNTKVNNVFYSKTWGKYVLSFSTINGNEQWASDSFDYVVCAMTHKALANLLQAPRPSKWTDAIFATYAPTPVFPYNKTLHPNTLSAFYPDVANQQGMSSVKIFQTMGGPATTQMASDGPFSSITATNGTTYENKVRVVFGKTSATTPGAPVGVTYILPTGTTAFPSCSLAIGLQYSWGSDSVLLRSGLLASDPTVNSALNATGKYFGARWNGTVDSTLVGALYNRVQAKTSTTGVLNGATHPAYFAPYRTYHPVSTEGNFAIVDWDRVPYILMGFKLDKPGYGNPSINRFAAQAKNSSPPDLLSGGKWDYNGVPDATVNKLYFCGDSFSYYGGWVEGAFQSAMNVVAGIAYSSATTLGQKSLLSISATNLVDQALPPFPINLYPTGATYS